MQRRSFLQRAASAVGVLLGLPVAAKVAEAMPAPAKKPSILDGLASYWPLDDGQVVTIGFGRDHPTFADFESADCGYLDACDQHHANNDQSFSMVAWIDRGVVHLIRG